MCQLGLPITFPQRATAKYPNSTITVSDCRLIVFDRVIRGFKIPDSTLNSQEISLQPNKIQNDFSFPIRCFQLNNATDLIIKKNNTLNRFMGGHKRI